MKKKFFQPKVTIKKIVFKLFLKKNERGNSTSIEINEMQIQTGRCQFSVVKLPTILKVRSMLRLHIGEAG